ncbi:MAG: nitroreductase family protein [Zoogloeaceae bacterium]|jgi:nitroreductase|nr:nitroreductase family protein [Zoogloeaceae bacterium]
MTQPRQSERKISPIFLERWSARAFDETEVSESVLQDLFEAARWAPSAYNAQPWRFVYARRGTPYWKPFLDLLIPYNRDWAQHASALVFAFSERKFVAPGKTEAIETGFASYDTGAAVAFLALQASLSGLVAHIIAGFDGAAIVKKLEVPEGFKLESAIVIGRKGNPEKLPEALQAREFPGERRPLPEFSAEGVFRF